ncbi:unnamed protein product [Paramecium sonneborni]|uniref:Uncharacterized protein n=1 Tax=Paramecium sonneborni TaxID=65129 RepID=A0A8S1P5Y7_9CILI|nr:unnamed protein product [Paramecium sonneborni]
MSNLNQIRQIKKKEKERSVAIIMNETFLKKKLIKRKKQLNLKSKLLQFLQKIQIMFIINKLNQTMWTLTMTKKHL